MARQLLSSDWWFRDRETGEITVAQFPNIPLWIFLAAILVSRITTDGSTESQAATHVGTAALAWWSVEEIVRGVNPWRRVLGAGGLTFVVARIAQAL